MGRITPREEEIAGESWLSLQMRHLRARKKLFFTLVMPWSQPGSELGLGNHVLGLEDIFPKAMGCLVALRACGSLIQGGL